TNSRFCSRVARRPHRETLQGPKGHSPNWMIEPNQLRPPSRSMASVQRLSGGLFLLVMAALLGSVAWWTWSGAMRDGMNAAVSITRLGANQAARMIESADLLLIDMQRIARVVDWRSDSMATMAQSELDLLVAELSHVTRLSVFAPDGSLRAS